MLLGLSSNREGHLHANTHTQVLSIEFRELYVSYEYSVK